MIIISALLDILQSLKCSAFLHALSCIWYLSVILSLAVSCSSCFSMYEEMTRAVEHSGNPNLLFWYMVRRMSYNKFPFSSSSPASVSCQIRQQVRPFRTFCSRSRSGSSMEMETTSRAITTTIRCPSGMATRSATSSRTISSV